MKTQLLLFGGCVAFTAPFLDEAHRRRSHQKLREVGSTSRSAFFAGVGFMNPKQQECSFQDASLIPT
jgi:hypothetical protein